MPEVGTVVVASEEPQHMQALARANRVRLARARLKRAVQAGEVKASEIVSETPWEAETMRLSELLTSQQRWGRTRTRKFLAGLGLSENKILASLTQRQRTLLAAALEQKQSTPALERQPAEAMPAPLLVAA